MEKYYPIMINIYKRPCIVIGGGKVSQRKVETLLEYGGEVTVISPYITKRLEELLKEKKIKVIEREYKEGDLKKYYLGYVAVDDPRVNERCLREGRKEGVLINVVDKPNMCDFIVPAYVKRGDLTIAISTNGKSPMLSRKIREDLEESFNECYEEYIDALGELRKMVLEDIKDINIRKEIFKKVIYSDLLDLYKNGEIKDIRKEIKDIYTKLYI